MEAARTLVARMVGGMLGRAAGADAANRAQQAEIEALHQRIERLSGMEAALERKREREKEQHDTFMRRLGHGLMAAACVAAGGSLLLPNGKFAKVFKSKAWQLGITSCPYCHGGELYLL